ncbi:complex I assembly factor TIMMDC1, mitochondrial [Polyodon spathula]|uniref:complex I assembly factor TIMMDC1, mitochondrial n=1 Tax=Polyodon spathula TaxID=7913 RepID=UPI001B7EA827|nr:complex I assembly factor TIMMDC1, mitochondrial [Polyodon spathula]
MGDGDMGATDNDMQTYSEEVTNIAKSAVMAAAVGMMHSRLPAARAARKRFIQQSQAEVFRHRVEALRSAHNAAIRGFIRYGWHWSWRVAAFVTLFNTVSTGLCVYRDKSIIGGLFRVNLWLGGLLAGTAIRAVLGLPAGVLMMAVQKAVGVTLRERKRREQREMYELKLAEWSSWLHVTEGLVGEMDSKIEENSPKSDLEKIEELLNFLRNQEQPGDSGKKLNQLHQKRSLFHQKRSLFHQKRSRFHQKRSRFHQKRSRFHQKRSLFHQKRSRFPQKRSRFHQKRSRFHQK